MAVLPVARPTYRPVDGEGSIQVEDHSIQEVVGRGKDSLEASCEEEAAHLNEVS